MATITAKNIPDEIYERLKGAASANRRSINCEIIVCLEQAPGARTIDPETVLAKARQLREMTGRRPLTDAQFTRAKTAGRP
jgi:plasmid stability protein